MKNKKGFTLVEIVVVIVILGILLAIAIPNVVKYIDKANDKSDQLTARNIYLAACSAAAEYYAENKTVPTQANIDDEIKSLASLTDEVYTVNFEANTAKVTSITYTGLNGAVTYPVPAPASTANP